MQVEVIYDNGVIKPLVPLKFKQKKLKMKIIVPDEFIETEPNKSEKTVMRERIDAILEQYAYPRPAVTPEQDKAVWHKHLVEKYGA